MTALLPVGKSVARMQSDATCDRITDVVRVGNSIICESFWREGDRPTSGSSVASMARTHLRYGERMVRLYTTAIPLPGQLRARTTVYNVTDGGDLA